MALDININNELITVRNSLSIKSGGFARDLHSFVLLGCILSRVYITES